VWQTSGQDDLIALFEKAFKQKNLSHAYLLTGPLHVGKTTLAYDLARAINCTGENPPCNECASCQRINKRVHSDVMEISLDIIPDQKKPESKNRTEIGIDEIKTLQQMASLPPYEGKNKIFIINGVDHISAEAANSLLKTLEEPFPGVVLILLASDESKIMPTIVSRCQRIRLKPVSQGSILKMLQSSYNLEGEKARLLSRLSRGCPGLAITAATDENTVARRTRIIDESIFLPGANIDERFSFIAMLENRQRGAEWRKAAEELLNTWISYWRDVLLIKAGCPEDITNLDYIPQLEEYAGKLQIPEIKSFISRLTGSLELISKNANIRLVMEVLMFDMPSRPITINK
jgi:DNA polymerase III subunit delta'